MDFAAIDFETANSNRASACAMAVVVVENNQIKDKKSWLIRPKKLYFDPYNIHIHGITENDVINEPEFDELWPIIKDFIKEKTIIAHNASFDLSVLRYLFNEYGIEFPNLNYSCSIIIAKKTWPGLPSYKLNLIAKHLGIKLKHHDPLEDAMACAEIARLACKIHNAASIEELAKIFKITNGKLFPGGYKPASQGTTRKY